MEHSGEMDGVILELRNDGKMLKEIADIVGFTVNQVNYRLKKAADSGLIERRYRYSGPRGKQRVNFADSIIETNAMRERGEL